MNIMRPTAGNSVLRNRTNEKCKTMSTIGVFQCTTSLLKKTHHHRNLSTTHRTVRIKHSYS